MKSYPLSVIILLCLAILLVDAVSFYWLQSVLQWVTVDFYKHLINGLFVFFSIGLVTAILVLKVRLDHIDVKRKQVLISSLYGLTVSSFIPKFIFVVFITILSLTNKMFSVTESLWIIPVFGVVAGILPFLAIVYAVFKAVYYFKTYHITVHHDDLPNAFDGLRVVHISDLHLGSLNYRYKVLDRAIQIINNLKPDVVCFTGDLVNNYAWELNGWENCFLKLSPDIKKYAVLGNHDYGDYSSWHSEEDKQKNFETLKQFYDKIQFKLLMNEWDVIIKNNEKLHVVGVENWGIPPFKQYGDLKQSIDGLQASDFKILMSHDPTHWSEEVVADTNIALTLAGHTHGMQAGLRIKNKTWSPIKYKYKHWAGLYKETNQYLYVNRGLGWLGFPGRLGMRPEITLLTLKK
ncbi:metallophosphoesterase [Formosa agariphila KMM 3901]|uniref:Metallophosphoesterase n=1 Tax=Formosa agariphila (strain DSM 15362 / KCTC 12365 / LMG 23005 / KMM 3901 / M-2Alg 35-1) TaxID=1347342 RepID=T2KK48_FORAG|nr:metallophosphoesterase [Formosa agariphila]CDF78374.1 metallophosphoesterase [Formosa agariphila KMM 3901]